jgi:hypothetical protein
MAQTSCAGVSALECDREDQHRNYLSAEFEEALISSFGQ